MGDPSEVLFQLSHLDKGDLILQKKVPHFTFSFVHYCLRTQWDNISTALFNQVQQAIVMRAALNQI